jgi:hypothetical protein
VATVDGSPAYPARLAIDYSEQRNRLTVAFRLILIIPILFIYGLISGPSFNSDAQSAGTSVAGGFFLATVLMLLFRQRYPRWWFDFLLAFNRFGMRVGAYFALLVDEYPSTEEEQRVHLDFDYPEAKQLNRWLPLVKWLLAIPHYIVLIVLTILAFFATLFAWLAIILVGRYPRGLYNFVVGVGRWWIRVQAYSLLLVTDRYPPFRLEP